MKLNIREKFLLSGISLTIISLSFFSWFSIQHATRGLKREQKERMSSLAKSLALNSQYGVLTLNREELEKLASSTLNQKDIVYVGIEDREGKVLVRLNKTGYEKEQTEEFVEPIIVERVIRKEEEMILDLNHKGEKTEKEEIGKVRIKLSLESLNKRITRLTYYVISVIFTMMLFIFGTSTFVVERYIANPIKELILATRKVSGGDLNYRVNIKNKDELGTLAEFFNKMTEDLKKSREILKEYSKTLEQKVRERTKELRESQEKLIQTSKMAAIGQLAGGVAHEINNPIGVILGFAQLVAKDIKETDPLYVPLKSIEREAIRCKKLVGDLLTFSRAGKTDKEMADVNELIDQTLSLITAQARVREVEIVKEYGSDLPQIMLNKNQFQQIIVNLCNNAIDAMPEGGKLTIKTSFIKSPSYPPFSKGEEKEKSPSYPPFSKGEEKSSSSPPFVKGEEGGFIEITVSDTGTGMSEEVKKRIFEPFFTTKDVGKGTGLGLSLVYEIIQKHNGTIDVESEVSKGTTFKIRLPL